MQTTKTHYTKSHKWRHPLRHWWHKLFSSKACPCGSGQKFKNCCGRDGSDECHYLPHKQ